MIERWRLVTLIVVAVLAVLFVEGPAGMAIATFAVAVLTVPEWRWWGTDD